MDAELARASLLFLLALSFWWPTTIPQNLRSGEALTPSSQFSKTSAQKSDSIIISPDGKKALYTSSGHGRKELWVMNIDGAAKRKISTVEKGEGVMSPTWSPDGKLIAFVVYNSAGHSPMTTMHVWIIRSDGRGAQKVALLKPNERFSTYGPQWRTSNDLIVKATTLADPVEQLYLYSYKTRKIQKISQKQ
jgi:Tol biopolymer transport system component